MCATGVLVHQVDWEADRQRTWSPGNQYADRFACALVNVRAPNMFSTSAVGYVLRPESLSSKKAVRCSYPGDGNSMNSNQGCRGDAYWGGGGIEQMLAKFEAHPPDDRGGCSVGSTPVDRNYCQVRCRLAYMIYM